jgi:hypothetical protein
MRVYALLAGRAWVGDWSYEDRGERYFARVLYRGRKWVR